MGAGQPQGNLSKLVAEAKQILVDVGFKDRKNISDVTALVLIALAGMEPGMEWSKATNKKLTIRKGVMEHIAKLGKKYAENSRETIRKEGVNALVAAGLAVKNPDTPSLPQNSSKTNYALTTDILSAMHRFGTSDWTKYAQKGRDESKLHAEAERRKRKRYSTEIQLPDGSNTRLSPGKHGLIIASILEEFIPRFIPEAIILYVSDTAQRMRWFNQDQTSKLGIKIDLANKLPDVIAFEQTTNSIIFIEAVDSGGEFTDQRVVELTNIFGATKHSLVFVTSFSSFHDFKRFSSRIAWDTDVWIADEIGHMIHYNGKHFLSHR